MIELRRFLAGFLGRLTTGLAAMGTLTWLLWPSSTWRPEPEPLLAFLLALFAWLTAVLENQLVVMPTPASPSTLEPHPHDVALLNRFNRTLPLRSRSEFRHQDFGTLFNYDLFSPYLEVAEVWQGADHEFENRETQAAFAELQNAILALGNKTAVWMYPSNNNARLLTPFTTIDEQQGVQPQTLARIAEMNNLSDRIAQALDNFLRVARQNVRQLTE